MMWTCSSTAPFLSLSTSMAACAAPSKALSPTSTPVCAMPFEDWCRRSNECFGPSRAECLSQLNECHLSDHRLRLHSSEASDRASQLHDRRAHSLRAFSDFLHHIPLLRRTHCFQRPRLVSSHLFAFVAYAYGAGRFHRS